MNYNRSMQNSKHSSEVEDLSSIIQLQQEFVMADMDLKSLMTLICHKTMAEDELENQIGLRLNIHTSLSGISVKTNEKGRSVESDLHLHQS